MAKSTTKASLQCCSPFLKLSRRLFEFWLPTYLVNAQGGSEIRQESISLIFRTYICLLNLMISNYDSHGKNVSLFFDKRNSRFTPAYDLVNVAMFPQFKHALAMAMGDEFEPESINAYQMADFAETCGVNKKLLSRQLTDLADRVINTLTQQQFIETITQEPHFTNDDRSYMVQVKEHVLVRTQHLRSQAADIPDIEV